MFDIRPIEKFFCKFGNKLDIIADDCMEWNDPSHGWFRSWRSFPDLMNRCYNCEVGCYPLIFWIVAILTAYGLLHAFCEFLCIYTKDLSNQRMWHKMRFRVLPRTFVQKYKLLVTLARLVTWIVLGYAVLTVSAAHFYPSIILQAFYQMKHFELFFLHYLSNRANENRVPFMHITFNFILLVFLFYAKNVFAVAELQNLKNAGT